jgi:deoxyribonuclease IV
MKSKSAKRSRTSQAQPEADATVRTKPNAKSKVKVSRGRDAPAKIPSLHLPPGVLLGAHTSTSGGVSQAIGRAQACGFTAAQIFVKNNKQWFAPPLSEEEISRFRTERRASGIYFFAHNSYLVNLGSQDPEMFSTSVRAMIAELERAEALELPFMVMHPGSHGGAGEEAGLARIAKGLDEIVRGTPKFHCRMAIEVTAGQGKSLGYRLEHLGVLLERVSDEKRFGICLDTAHLYAAGYNVRTWDGYQETVGQVEKLFGTKRVLGLHLNDSKVPLGKRVDRHEHLGVGEIGLDCFKWIVQDPRWASTPKVLETPKSEDMHEDVGNLQKLAPYLQP